MKLSSFKANFRNIYCNANLLIKSYLWNLKNFRLSLHQNVLVDRNCSAELVKAATTGGGVLSYQRDVLLGRVYFRTSSPAKGILSGNLSLGKGMLFGNFAQREVKFWMLLYRNPTFW